MLTVEVEEVDKCLLILMHQQNGVFSTYMRPFGAVPAADSGTIWEPHASISGNPQHAVEEALWAYFVGATRFYCW